jgi:radial spoke head protein 9
MNINDDLENKMKYISDYNGVSLNIEERLKLEIALNNLYLNIKSDEMWFWGKIIGIEKDYYVAVAIYYRENHIFPKKKFFFCNNSNYFFSEVPECMDYHTKDALKFNTYFIGNPDVILENYDENPDERNNNEEMSDNEDYFYPRLKKKNFTESDRLSFFIRSVDNECGIVPEGSFKMLPIQEMRRNENFTGKKFIYKI